MQLYFNYRVSHQLELVNPATVSLHSTTCVHTYGIYCNNKAVQRSSLKQVGHSANLTIHTGLTELKHGGLSQVAASVLGVPAASTSSEHCFSVAGRTLDDRRSQLNPDTVG